MSVQKAVTVSATGTSIEAAVEECLDRADLTLQNITRFEVTRIAGTREEIGVLYEVELTIWFTLLEHMHAG